MLHTRPYRNTSLLVDFFTYDYGRLTAIAKGARQKRPRFSGAIRPFTPVTISLSGMKELKTLIHIETASTIVPLVGRQIFCGLYLNELIQRVLQPYDAHYEVYEGYELALRELVSLELEIPLRKFEFMLLNEIGYGINFSEDCGTGESIVSGRTYVFDPNAGFSQLEQLNQGSPVFHKVTFQAEEIFAVGRLAMESPQCRLAAKKIARLALAPRIGNRPLKSRELFSFSNAVKS